MTRVYGAVACDKRQPESDMHGLFRVVVRAANAHQARSVARQHGVKRTAFWAASESVVEQHVVGGSFAPDAQVAVVPLACACIQARYYRVLELA